MVHITDLVISKPQNFRLNGLIGRAMIGQITFWQIDSRGKIINKALVWYDHTTHIKDTLNKESAT
jgi:hypothetical protein